MPAQIYRARSLTTAHVCCLPPQVAERELCTLSSSAHLVIARAVAAADARAAAAEATAAGMVRAALSAQVGLRNALQVCMERMLATDTAAVATEVVARAAPATPTAAQVKAVQQQQQQHLLLSQGNSPLPVEVALSPGLACHGGGGSSVSRRDDDSGLEGSKAPGASSMSSGHRKAAATTRNMRHDRVVADEEDDQHRLCRRQRRRRLPSRSERSPSATRMTGKHRRTDAR